MAATPLILSPLGRTSPTLWAHMRLCGLRAALASTRNADRWVLHDPRAWLGSIFHAVVETAARPGATVAAAEVVWNREVARRVKAILLHPLDARFAVPDRWPSYYLVRQRALSSAGELASRGRLPGQAGRGSSAASKPTPALERLLEARGGRLVGRPDHFNGSTVSDYKSAFPDPAWSGAAEIVEGFRRQVRLYAAIIADALGSWPANGRVIAASGEVLAVSIDHAVCDAEADAAVSALDALNDALALPTAPKTVAKPSAIACGSCPYLAICPVFWSSLGSTSLADWRSAAAVEGVLERVDPGLDGDLFTAHLALRSATHKLHVEQVITLRKSTHGDLTTSRHGALLRIVSAKIKPDGRLRADLSTLAFDVLDLPELATPSGEPARGPH